jgi:hypothetical protein
LKDFYESTANQTITSHTILDTGVVRVLYENGVSITINYNDSAVTTVDNQKIDALSYQIRNV